MHRVLMYLSHTRHIKVQFILQINDESKTKIIIKKEKKKRNKINTQQNNYLVIWYYDNVVIDFGLHASVNKNGMIVIHLPGGLSITVNNPVRRVRLPPLEVEGADMDASISFEFEGEVNSSVLGLTCMYLKISIN